MSKYFVMLNHPAESVPAAPMVNDDDEVEFYETYQEAANAAQNSWLGDRLGYEIFCLGCGENR